MQRLHFFIGPANNPRPKKKEKKKGKVMSDSLK
jgi:hypothetical protein